VASAEAGLRFLDQYHFPLQTELKRPYYEEEAYALYRRYQIAVHKDPPDEVTPEGYRRFLIKSCLLYTQHADGPHLDEPVETATGHNPTNAMDDVSDSSEQTPTDRSDSGPLLHSSSSSKSIKSNSGQVEPHNSWPGYGSFHQHYRLPNGQLVAVGVIDLLPEGLSSVYVFYDPDLPTLSLGRYTALAEMRWTRDAMRHIGDSNLRFRWYMMGYYVHNCSKMRYKAQFSPSVLLCPFSHRWVPFREAVSLMEVDQRAVIGGQAAHRETLAHQEALRQLIPQIRRHPRFFLQSMGVVPVSCFTEQSQEMVTNMLAPALLAFCDRELFFNEFVFTT